MENYILLSEEFIKNTYGLDSVKPINEGIFKGVNKSALEKMLAPTLETGDDIFKSINQSVDELEEAIEHYNDDLKINKKTTANKAEQLLTVEFDKNKLKLNNLIEVTTIKSGSFTKDILLSNIINYRVFLSPIRMAKIMSLGYKYYMTIIRQALQQALVTVELNADMFFTLVRDGIAGTDRKIMEVRRLVIEETLNSVKTQIGDEYANMGGTSKSKKVKKEATDTLNAVIDKFRKMKGLMDNGRGNDYGGYRQNIFQETGRHIESLVKDDNQKELAAMAEQFNNLAQKPSKEGRDNMLAAYAASVKLAAEIRANKICSKMHLNLIDIMKMFSVRAQEGLSSLFEGMDKREEWEKNIDAEIEKQKGLESDNEALRKENAEWREKYEELMENNENFKKLKDELFDMGFDELPLQDNLNNVLTGKKTPADMLMENGFSYTQTREILSKGKKVGDYEYSEKEINDNGAPKKWTLKK